MTPRFLLSDHLNLHLPIQNHHIYNHLVHSTQTHGSSQQNPWLSYLHTPTSTHKQKYTHCSYTIILPPPNNSTQWILVILAIWWNSTTSYEDQHSPKNSTIYQFAPCHTGYLRISVYLFNGSLFWSSNIFLNDLCHYMVIFTPSLPMD